MESIYIRSIFVSQINEHKFVRTFASVWSSLHFSLSCYIYIAQPELCSGGSRGGQYLEARLEPMTAVIILKATLTSLHGAENIPWKFISFLTQLVVHIRYCYILLWDLLSFICIKQSASDSPCRHVLFPHGHMFLPCALHKHCAVDEGRKGSFILYGDDFRTLALHHSQVQRGCKLYRLFSL
jgi:hypothetical protein